MKTKIPLYFQTLKLQTIQKWDYRGSKFKHWKSILVVGMRLKQMTTIELDKQGKDRELLWQSAPQRPAYRRVRQVAHADRRSAEE
jgi:hypothetical protein